MKRAVKGSRGYVRYEKVKRGLITLLMFAIPLTIFFTGLVMTGTRKNLLTVVAILGVLPAARFAVSWIMMLLQKETPAQVEAETEQAARGLVHAYELTVTAYEGRMPLDALAVRGGSVACLSLNGKTEQMAFMEKHIEQILSQNGYKKTKVKIFPEQTAFLERLKAMALAEERQELSEDETMETPDSGAVTRDEKILAVIKAISL